MTVLGTGSPSLGERRPLFPRKRINQPMRTRYQSHTRWIRAFALLLIAAAAGVTFAPLHAQHSDILLNYEDGVFRTDRLLYQQDIRENALSDDGTIWATDNPGFAGSGFKFRDEFHFDITGPLRRWADGRWSSEQVDEERIRYFQPSPFGEPVNLATIGKSTDFAEGFLIQRASTLGRIHQHFTFELSTHDGGRPADGAYAFEMVARSPTYGVTPEFTLVFKNGLSQQELAVALLHLSKIRLAAGEQDTLTLVWESVEGVTYQWQSRAGFNEESWSDHGAPVTGTGEIMEMVVSHDGTSAATFFRLRQSLAEN